MPATPLGPQSRLDRLAGQLGIAIVLASILGGLSFLLRHIGLIDPAGYAADLARFCHPPLQTLWLPASCRAWSWLDGAGGAITRLDMARLYQISPPELLLKLLRHGLMAGLVLISGLVVWRHPALRLPPRQLLLWVPLQLSLGVALWIGLQRGPLPAVLAGLPGQLWVPLVPLCGWLLPRRRLQRLVDAVAALLLLHLPVLVLEAMRGLPLRHATRLWGVPLPGRLPGLMGQPNTLGVVVVLGLAFCLAFSARAWHRPVLVAAALPQLLLARSGMGLLALALLLLWPSLQRQWQRHPRRALLLAPVLAAALLLVLPHLLGRPDLLESISGRWGMVGSAVRSATPWQLLLGRGLGSGGVVVSRWQEVSSGLPPLFSPLTLPSEAAAGPALWPTDSFFLHQFIEAGLLGLAALLGLIAAALRRDRASRPFLLLVLLCGLSLNLGEVFPLGLLLAVSLCHALAPGHG
ncbi:MAG: hypothetical protein QUV07_00740 [Cyanobium sp. CZS 25K]|nr:hypothetical protein [Cyanobium sp. CZS25K]